MPADAQPTTVPQIPDAAPDDDASGAALAVHVALSALLGFAVVVVWFAAGAGPFWPRWAWLGLALTIAFHAMARARQRQESELDGVLQATMLGAATVGGTAVVVWALAGGGSFWPAWPLLASAFAVGATAIVRFRHQLPGAPSRDLVERVDELTRTRRGALDVQAAELRRIERDLHDGAQARLVALSMQLGRAEHRLQDSGDAATHDLVRAARTEASAAIAELRDLARGIAPPVLADRGLVAAAEALGRRSPIDVTVEGDLSDRPVPVVESAAYFVIAEALTNAIKHSPGAAARVRLARAGSSLLVTVTDDGVGGADPHGGGLEGLRSRVEALDGTLLVHSPPGAGTIVHAELPCGS